MSCSIDAHAPMPRSNKVFQVKKPQDEAVDMAQMPFWKSSSRNVNRYRAYVKVVRVWVPEDKNAACGPAFAS